jgi:hypothetical protein
MTHGMNRADNETSPLACTGDSVVQVRRRRAREVERLSIDRGARVRRLK